MSRSDGSNSAEQPAGRTAPARDLADFLLRWPEFRAQAQASIKRKSLRVEDRKVIGWLIELADRVGPGDLK